ncbi:MAG TPA: hypothetical protein PLS50_07245, partial [Candidatus Dojkabacteria bacterium]|nr:hypothetical protein [Candidatus Dojkabacteria bacterium]
MQSVILLPAAYRHITPLLNEFFRIACLERPKIVYVGRSSVTISKTENLFRVSKQLVKALRLRRQIRAKLTERLFQEKTNVFIYSVSGNSENKIENNGDLGAVYQLSANISNSIGIPFISSLDYNWKETDSQFVSAYPSLFELWRMFREQIRMFNHLTSFRNKTCLVGEIEIPFELVSQEMLLGLRYSHMVNLAWFSNYFERLDAGVKVFFSDEFYTTGRILSAAARKCNRKNITTYGVQHGLLLENHTVYRISDLEFEDFIRRNDGLPKPDFFVTWGSYFSNLFLQINSLPEEYVIAAGNLKYCTL